MEVEREAEAGFLHQFVSKFSASCRDAEREQSDAPTIEAGVLLVRVAGEVLLYGSTHLAQVKILVAHAFR